MLHRYTGGTWRVYWWYTLCSCELVYVGGTLRVPFRSFCCGFVVCVRVEI